MDRIKDNVARLREALDAAAPGRRIYLVAASKMNGADRVREAVAAGVDACGENRVQELLEKNALGAYGGAELHFIGHLQKNKVRQVVGVCSLIQSVSDGELLSLINARAEKMGIIQEVLLEINIGAEPQKGGFSPDGLPAALASAAGLRALSVRGLMAIPPADASPGASRPYFARMRQLFVDIGGKKYDNVRMDFLSMGMSGDYLDAVAEGANMVRVGSAIFGERHYAAPAPATEVPNGNI